MENEFPGAVPQDPGCPSRGATEYYRACLGFELDWGDEEACSPR